MADEAKSIRDRKRALNEDDSQQDDEDDEVIGPMPPPPPKQKKKRGNVYFDIFLVLRFHWIHIHNWFARAVVVAWQKLELSKILTSYSSRESEYSSNETHKSNVSW